MEFADQQTGVKARKIKGSARQYAQKGWTLIQPIDRTFAASRNNIMVTCKQFPLVMSAARTIHKAQSATHQQIIVDMSGPTCAPSTFWEHMHYVAFSCCTTLSGLHVIDINVPKIRASPKVCKFLQKDQTPVKLCYQPTYKMSDHIAITYNNVCSITKKWSALKNNKNIINSSIIIFAETWLFATQLCSEFTLPGFHQVRMDSKHRVGHRGMLLYYSESLQVRTTTTYQLQYVEIVHCQVDLEANMCHVIGIYKPPATSLEQLMTELQNFISSLRSDHSVIVIGDFNIDVTEVAGQQLLSNMKQIFNMEQLATGPTTWYDTQIDLVFTNQPASTAYALMNTWSQHHTIVAHVPSAT